MTPIPTAKLGSPGIDRFSPAQLLRTARLFASDPELPTLVDPDSGKRHWVELDSNAYLQIWLLSWPAGTHTEWHDHGDSAGGFPQRPRHPAGADVERPRFQRPNPFAGDGRSFGPNHIHHVANVGLQPAISIHVYTPRLTTMTQYDETPAGLQVRTIDRVGVNW